MDVIFLNSGPSSEENLHFFSRYIGPYKLAHWLRKHGYACQVIDFIPDLTEEQLDLALRKFLTKDTLVLGISTTFLYGLTRYLWKNGRTGMFPEHLVQILLRIKTEYPGLKIVLGGYGSDRAWMAGIPDAAIMSYTTATEDIFLEYVEHLRTGSPRPLGRLETSFIGQAEANRPRLVYDQARDKKYNIEQDDFRFVREDIILPGEPLPLDVSRGCIFACRFCQYPHLGKKKLDYVRGMEYIRDELIYNHENFGTTHYMMLDDTFNDTEWKIKNFHDMVSALPFNIDYTAYLRADLIDRFPDTAHMLKDSGLWGAFHGLESLHPYASKLVGKAWSGTRAREYIPRLYHDIWSGQVPQQLSFIIGLPRETKDDIKDTIRWYEENKLYLINFKALNINGNNNQRSNRSILSEFDRDPEKYGFKFQEIPADPESRDQTTPRSTWYNETWTRTQATEFQKKVNRYLLDKSRISVWNLGSTQFLGLAKDTLMTTYLDHNIYGKIRSLEKAQIQAYFHGLMAS